MQKPEVERFLRYLRDGGEISLGQIREILGLIEADLALRCAWEAGSGKKAAADLLSNASTAARLAGFSVDQVAAHLHEGEADDGAQGVLGFEPTANVVRLFG